jgi:hypothetical protein
MIESRFPSFAVPFKPAAIAKLQFFVGMPHRARHKRIPEKCRRSVGTLHPTRAAISGWLYPRRINLTTSL